MLKNQKGFSLVELACSDRGRWFIGVLGCHRFLDVTDEAKKSH